MPEIKSVAIIGAGAAGAITSAALAAEKYFERIRVFERRETAGGTWIYDAEAAEFTPPTPGALPPTVDPALPIPDLSNDHGGRKTTKPSTQERYSKTPVYEHLTTNVPQIAMCFSDQCFPTPAPSVRPFVPHHIPRQYIENYFSMHETDQFISTNTTVEDVSRNSDKEFKEEWKLTLRKYDSVKDEDEWWEERFDAVIIANGHYSVPFIPEVKGLEAYIKNFPGVVQHSKVFRSPRRYNKKKVLVIGNAASGHDIAESLISAANLPIYQSRRSPNRWDGASPPHGIAWKPVISEFLPTGRIIFEDGTHLDGIDHVIYCTGYKQSFPFWNQKTNGGPLWNYEENRVPANYLHTFLSAHPSVALMGVPRVLTFRSFEYQAIAIARVFSGRSREWLNISKEEKKRWEESRVELVKRERRNFHDIEWDSGETADWMGALFNIAGLGTLSGHGMVPPILSESVKWAVDHIRKYPEPGKGDVSVDKKSDDRREEEAAAGWVMVRSGKDSLSFV